jgi:phospho-N-acetylmuramoyl-pentapeptide-transferase
MLDRLFPLYAAAFILSFTITAVAERRLIPFLSGKAKQPIYGEGPSWHLSKSGTPTMGGLAFLAAIGITLLLSSLVLFGLGEEESALSLMICLAYAALNSLVGIFDDLKKLKRKENRGLSPKEKLILQFFLAFLFLFARRAILGEGGYFSFSFGRIQFGWLYYLISLIMLVGIVNCANLTDGIDGLASGVAFSAGVVIFYISASLVYDASLISSAVMGAAVGFLIFNIHPAKIFMGDTGSLFFGAILISAFFSLDNPLLAIPILAVYVLEGVSVVIQVLVFKLTKKRVFRMAPLHHHLEKLGMSENKICIIAMLLTFIASVPAFILYLP